MGDETEAIVERHRFTGAYPCNYTTPDRVSRWISPGDVLEWVDGPPDGNWVPVTSPEEVVQPEPRERSECPPGTTGELEPESEAAGPPEDTAPSTSDAEKE